jgi:spore maturation protein CgeB
MQQRTSYSATPLYSADGTLCDIEISVGTRRWKMLGAAGAPRELSILVSSPTRDGAALLPVFIGSGTGIAIRKFMESYDGPLAVVDKEPDIADHTGIRQHVLARAGSVWIDSDSADDALRRLTLWQTANGAAPLRAMLNPAWLRLDRSYYAAVHEAVTASEKADFWGKVAYPRFQSTTPRILLITSQYFLMGEVVAALNRMQVPYELLALDDDSLGQNEFVERLLKAVVSFRPDFALTINHLGVDREGVLTDLLARLQLPLASWFVDNPHLILYMYKRLVSPWTALFTWDADNLESLRRLGFAHVFHLPLGTDVTRFVPLQNPDASHPLRADVSFVGNSMVYKVAQRMKAGRFPAVMLRSYKTVAAGFSNSDERCVRTYLEQARPDIFAAYLQLPASEQRLAYETMITWEATRQYRNSCVRQTLAFHPLIVGDRGWRTALRHEPATWRAHSELSYYTDLPWFYPLCTINFNCTSKQMKGAVNQRVFDVPACGAFLLTDKRKQMDELFEPGKEVIFYSEPEEAPELIRFYLKNSAARAKVVAAARSRILASHTYEHRLRQLMNDMRTAFGRP